MAAIRTRHIPGTPGLTVDEAGTGELVLFMHGIGGNRTNWTRQVQTFGEHCLAVCLERHVESVLVSEDDIRAGFRFLYERAKLAAEPGAAAGVGALLAGKLPDVQGKTVAVVVSGGNVAPKTAAAILSANEA